MGQNSSSAFQNSSAPLFPRKSKPPPRPSQPPKIPEPKTPTYVVPENKVLPNGVQDMSNARKLLRPVSQELTRFHPDFVDIFQTNPDAELQGGDASAQDINTALANKENEITDLNASTNSAQLPNGHSSHVTNGAIPNGNVSSSRSTHTKMASNLSSPRKIDSATLPKVDPNPRPQSATNLRRSQSMDKERSQPTKMSKHKRQTSLTNGIQENVIFEDPREHLYNVSRHELFSNYQPSTTSLPLKSSFDMDYSMNLTYAQLAEYRRQKRVNELEERTGKKLEALGAEINASSTVPKSPFDRQNLGGKSGTHSVSTGSSETGVSKSKKKKAPAPPPPGPPARETSPGRFSLNTEPPADYDMDETSSQIPSRQGRSLTRSVSSASGSTKPPAPQPLPKNFSSLQRPAKTPVTQSEPSLNVPPPPPLPESFSKTASHKGPVVESTGQLPGHSSLQRSMSQAKAQLEALKKLEDTLKRPKAVDGSTTSTSEIPSPDPSDTTSSAQVNADETRPESPQKSIGTEILCDDNGNRITNGEVGVKAQSESHEIPVADLNSQSQAAVKPSTSTPETNSPTKRMSSLLQHDIILAAQARGAKIVKSKPPATLEKPKDAAEMFREELAKAATAREERMKESQSNSSKESSRNSSVPSTPREDKNIVFQSSFLKVARKPTKQMENNQEVTASPAESKTNLNTDLSNPNDTAEELKEITKTLDDLDEDQQAAVDSLNFSKRPSIQSEDMSISSSNTSQRIFSPDWTPEQDLDSDDDIMDEKCDVTERRVSSEGFKSSIIPPKITELKASKKKKKATKLYKQDSGEISVDEKNKFGSIRKFKKTVHEGVRHAFGSISKAPGKLLKKQKSHEFLDVREPIPQSPPPESDEDQANVSANSNWVFAANGKGSLRRTASDGQIDIPYQSGASDSEYSDNSAADEVGDIDFANGIDIDPKPNKKVKRFSGSEQNLKTMKRAGVAYVSQKGQIIVLPESQPVKVDAKGRIISDHNREDAGHAPKLFRQKNKKFSYESTVRMQEKSRVEAAMAREIQEKEKQIELEREKQQEMEKGYWRLRELETQEQLQRMHNANMREQITLLQQQQVRQAHNELNNNAVSMPSLNNLNAVPNGGSMHPHYASNGHIPTSQYVVNGSVGVGNNNYVMNANQYSHTTPLVSEQRYSMPLFSTSVLGQPTPHSNLATTPNPANFTTHSAPMVGGQTIGRGLGTSSVPNLTSQELTNLSDYMRMMGVTPPSNQQQWAVLLSTISLNTPGYPIHGQNGFSTMGNGPDLSTIFGGGKTLDSTTMGNKKQIISIFANQQPFQAGDVASIQRMHGDGLYYKSLQMLDAADPQIPHRAYHQQQQEPPLPPPPTQLISEVTDSSPATTTTTKEQPPQTVPPPTIIKPNESEQGVVRVKVPDFQNTAPEDRMDYLTSTNDFSVTVNGETSAHNESVSSSQMSKSPVLPAKVYGPIGFRPVAFRAGSS